jgi:hypothetical protein
MRLREALLCFDNRIIPQLAQASTDGARAIGGQGALVAGGVEVQSAIVLKYLSSPPPLANSLDSLSLSSILPLYLPPTTLQSI